jgi:hypothetical protein
MMLISQFGKIIRIDTKTITTPTTSSRRRCHEDAKV